MDVKLYVLKPAHNSESLSINQRVCLKLKSAHNSENLLATLPCLTWLVSCILEGDSGGRTSTRMLRESVFLEREVGAAASRTLSRAIMYWGRLGSSVRYSRSVGLSRSGRSMGRPNDRDLGEQHTYHHITKDL